jgi:probable poly-beta-1,6-N-acetyl-D-glucosamine export protein
LRTPLVGSLLPGSSALDLSSVSTSVATEADSTREGTAQGLFSSAGDGDSSGGRSDYRFVSNVRFLSMIAIVWVHMEYLFGAAMRSPWMEIRVVLRQSMKFGSIGFFLISGFLLGEGLTRMNPRRYFDRRLKAVLLPWLFWGAIWFAVSLSFNLLEGDHQDSLRSSMWVVVGKYFQFVFTQSIYWFVPNYFVCLAIVCGLYRRVPNFVQGAVFFAISLFYGVNVYLEVLPPRHTSAFLGFVFYLWLGMSGYLYREVWDRWLNRISWTRLVGYAVVAGVLALAETYLLRKMHAVDAANSLRISNQVFSVVAVLLIVKCKRAVYPSAIDVRSTTFGIFLIHPFLIRAFQVVTKHVDLGGKANGALMLAVGLLAVVVVYMCSLALTKLILRSHHLRWMVGG